MNTNTKPLILVVDDQPNNLKVISSILKNEYSLSLANNGNMALSILEKIRPDLILLDIMMPDMDGYETCKKIKDNPHFAQIPIIFLTAKNDIEDMVKGFNIGAVDYIIKPFNLKELRVRIENHLSLYLAKKKIEEQKQELELKNKLLIESEEALRKTNAEKDKFFSIIAHDLKSPFSGLLGLLSMLNDKDSGIEEEERDFIVEELFKSSKSVYNLIENLLEWSRIQRHDIKMNPQFTNINFIIDELYSLLKSNLDQKGITFNSNIGGLSITADTMMLNTLFRNLISNAIKFSNSGDSISVNYQKNEGMHQFCVEDTGIGMSEEIKNKLFRIDTKVTKTGTNNESGTGLGLILCKEFAEMHNGNIWVESEPGKGSKFYFTIADDLE
jgi:two-component system sensor histidine kinase/response regulator